MEFLSLFNHQTHDNLIFSRKDPGSKICRGSQNPMSKLNEMQVREIKKMLRIGVKQKEIALKFKVGRGAIEHIACGSTWRHID